MGVEGEESWCLLWVPEREIKPSRYEICQKFPRGSEAAGLHVLNVAIPSPAAPLFCVYALTIVGAHPVSTQHKKPGHDGEGVVCPANMTSTRWV